MNYCKTWAVNKLLKEIDKLHTLSMQVLEEVKKSQKERVPRSGWEAGIKAQREATKWQRETLDKMVKAHAAYLKRMDWANETLKDWCKEGCEKRKKYLVLVMDRFPYKYSPVYADDEKDLEEKYLECANNDYRCVAATFDLRFGYDGQVDAYTKDLNSRFGEWCSNKLLQRKVENG